MFTFGKIISTSVCGLGITCVAITSPKERALFSPASTETKLG